MTTTAPAHEAVSGDAVDGTCMRSSPPSGSSPAAARPATQPTQGVDLHAKATIHGLARDRLGAPGRSSASASSDDTELCDTCDRVLVMRDGQVVVEVDGDRRRRPRVWVLQLAGSSV